MNKTMQEDSNPIKDVLFDYLKSEKKILDLVSQSKFTDIIENALDNLYDKVVSMGKKEESLGILATGLLHYLLTNALIPSQRKIEYNKIDIDIVIPNLKTLETDPKKSLIIYIPKSSENNVIKEKLNQLEKIQPIKDNIWIVTTKKLDFQNKTYEIKKNNSSFSEIINDVGQFVNVQGESKFKILRI